MLGLGLVLGFGDKMDGAAAGGGSLPFTDDFSGTLDQFTQVGAGGIASGEFQVTGDGGTAIGAIWVNGLIPAGEGSWDVKTKIPRTAGTFEQQIAVLADEDLQTQDLPVQDNVGTGYAARIAATTVTLHELNDGGASLGQFGTGTIAAGSEVIIRTARNGDGDLTFTCLVGGVQKGSTITRLFANQPAGLGTGVGFSALAGDGVTVGFDDVNVDVTA